MIKPPSQIRLRPTSPEDLSRVLQAERHSENARFIRQWTEGQHLSAIDDDTIAHWIVEAESDGRFLGYVILLGLGGCDRSIELKRIVISEKGKGVGRDTLRAVKAVVFEQLQAHRLWLEVVSHNSPAQRLYRTEGFAWEGVLRDAARIQGRVESLIMMSILEPEWLASKSASAPKEARHREPSRQRS